MTIPITLTEEQWQAILWEARKSAGAPNGNPWLQYPGETLQAIDEAYRQYLRVKRVTRCHTPGLHTVWG